MTFGVKTTFTYFYNGSAGERYSNEQQRLKRLYFKFLISEREIAITEFVYLFFLLVHTVSIEFLTRGNSNAAT
jgi:hypothetical protein